MLQHLDITNVILLVKSVLAVSLSFFLIRLVWRSGIYLPLLIFTLLVIVELLFLILVNNDLIKNYPYLIDINEPFFLLNGLLLFLYARNHIYHRFYVQKSDLLFLIPFVLAILSYLPDFLLDPQTKIAHWQDNVNLKNDVHLYIWEWNFYLIINGYFLAKAIKVLEVYNADLKSQFSEVRNASLNYTQYLIKISLGLFGIELVFVYLTYYGFPFYNELYLILHALSGLVLLMVGLDAIISHKYVEANLKAFVPFLPVKAETPDEKNEKYARSSLNEDSMRDIKMDLIDFMESDKPYLKPLLRIRDLAELTGIPAHHISQVLNDSFDQNFYEFVNGYRVREAMNILKDPDCKNYTFESIAYQSGFNSRSAFYNAFKKINNLTPSQFLKEDK